MADQYDILQVKKAFEGNVETFIHEYYPEAKRKGNNYLVGSVNGGEGSSTYITYSGRHVGKYKDFAEGDPQGDLIDMLRKKKGISLQDAIKEIAELYGVKPSLKFENKPIQVKKVAPIKKTVACEDRVKKYLTEERGIPQDVIDKYRIESVGNNEIAFPYIDRKGEIIQRSYISLNRTPDGKKISMQDKGANKMFFGLHLLKTDARKIIITEGQVDCMTLTTVGVENAVSMPAGVNNLEWIDVHWDLLMSMDEIILAFDQDDAGRDCVGRVAKRLGLERCKRLSFDEKDINDLWNNGYDEADIKKIIESAEFIPNDSVEALGSSRESIKKFFKKQQENEGVEFFLEGVDLRQRMGELTIWSGYSGSGKTTLLNQQILHIVSTSNHKVCYASFEQSKSELELLCIQQINGRVTDEVIDETCEYLQDKIYWYNYETPVKHLKIFDSFTYAMRRYGCDVFVVDNLVTCGVNEDDTEVLKGFVNMLKDFCKDNNVSIHLVAHSRKSQQDDNESKIPSKHSVRGHSSITDVCMNGLTVWRNPDEIQDRAEKVPFDGIIKIWKQRHNGVTGSRGYYFNGAFKRATARSDMHVAPINIKKGNDEKSDTNVTRKTYRKDLLEDIENDF